MTDRRDVADPPGLSRRRCHDRAGRRGRVAGDGDLALVRTSQIVLDATRARRLVRSRPRPGGRRAPAPPEVQSGDGDLVVAVVLTCVFGGIVLLLGPKAVDQASTFADELPATIEQFYSWPVIGPRLGENDAAGRAQNFVDDLPSRFDTDSISRWRRRLLGGLGATLLVLVTTVAVLLDGDAIVRRGRRLVPPARRETRRRGRAHRVPLGRPVLRRLAHRRVAERHRDPHRRAHPRRPARPARRHLGGDHATSSRRSAVCSAVRSSSCWRSARARSPA